MSSALVQRQLLPKLNRHRRRVGRVDGIDNELCQKGATPIGTKIRRHQRSVDPSGILEQLLARQLMRRVAVISDVSTRSPN